VKHRFPVLSVLYAKSESIILVQCEFRRESDVRASDDNGNMVRESHSTGRPERSDEM
jgi:hypothetical protein